MNRLLLAALALACASSSAFAAAVGEVANTAVVLPYGDWIAAFGQTLTSILVPLLVTAVTGLVSTLAWPLRLILTNAMIDRCVRLAVDYAVNAVAGAVKGKALTVPVGSRVISVAVQRAIDSTPAWVMKAAGGPTGIAERVFRALHLEDNANVTNTLVPALEALPTK